MRVGIAVNKKKTFIGIEISSVRAKTSQVQFLLRFRSPGHWLGLGVLGSAWVLMTYQILIVQEIS